MWLLPIAGFSYIYILQGSVTTQLRCGGIFNNHFIANCPESVLVNEFWKSVFRENIEITKCNIFWDTVYVISWSKMIIVIAR